MTRVLQLTPGDEVGAFGRSGTFIARCPHPLFPGLQLVVWKMDDGSWSHDALRVEQDVGEAAPTTEASRELRLRRALLGHD